MKRVRQGTALLALVVLFVCPAIADGAGEPGFGCKRVYRGKAQVNPNPGGRPPLIIGDSTVLLPIPNLTAVGYSVNARGCRGIGEAIDVAAKLRGKHRLPHLVLMNDYANGGITLEKIQEALDVLGPRRVLGLATEYDGNTGHPPAPDTDVIFKARKRFKHRIAVLDWVHYSLPHHRAEPAPDAWFLPDLFHPNFTGAEAYAQFLAGALPLAKEGKFPKRGG
jgi:hypothetical protein